MKHLRMTIDFRIDDELFARAIDTTDPIEQRKAWREMTDNLIGDLIYDNDDAHDLEDVLEHTNLRNYKVVSVEDTPLIFEM